MIAHRFIPSPRVLSSTLDHIRRRSSLYRPKLYPTVTMASTKKGELYEGFLEGPAPNLTRKDVDWVKGGIPEYEGMWATVLDGVMTEKECDLLVAAAEARTHGKWERAMVNIGGGMQALYEDTRNCGRIIWDNHDIMAKLWARVEAAVPEIHRLDQWAGVTGN